MKASNFCIYFLALSYFIVSKAMVGCKKENEPPECKILKPFYKDEFNVGKTIDIIVDAKDNDGKIESLSISINDSLIYKTTVEPFQTQWNTNLFKEGEYSLEAIAIDNYGNSTSDKIVIDLKNMYENSVEDIDGNIYKTMSFGNKIWMVENLRTTHYADGTPIPLIESANDWMTLGVDGIGMCYFNNDPRVIIGGLYTWKTAMKGQEPTDNNPSGVQGICPDGWHLPGFSEWKELGDYNDKKSNVAEDYWDSLCEDKEGEVAQFGIRNNYGEFENLGVETFYWTTSQHNFSYANCVMVVFFYSQLYKYGYDFKGNGFSVRCVKDEE